MISLVIPTYNEVEVIGETLRRGARALESVGEEFELIVVDDASADGTAERAEALAREFRVRVLRRSGRLGLATAVIAGWELARGGVWGVMDADLQHPPEVLSELARALQNPNVDLAVASRYIAGGGTSAWSPLRRFISWGATHLAASILPWTLHTITDPMSGMFLVRASALRGARLDPVGYKIFLEVLAKGRFRELVEVPYVFGERGQGTSKLGPSQYLEYLAHLLRLARATGQLRAWFRYGAVGLAGGGVDVLLTYWFVERLGWRLTLASPLAIELALFSNFFWNHALTFRAQASRDSPILSKLSRYQKVCAPGAILNALLTLLLTAGGIPLVTAAALGVLAGGIWNFLFNIPAIWRVWVARSAPGAPSFP